MRTLERITVTGYKSIRELRDFELGDLNVLIGANGAGKSNFLSVFKLLSRLVNERLQLFVAQSGGADFLLNFGPKVTNQIELRLQFGNKTTEGYGIKLVPAAPNKLVIAEEVCWDHEFAEPTILGSGKGKEEAGLKDMYDHGVIVDNAYSLFQDLELYHFQDTTPEARVKQNADIYDNHKLKSDARNLASFLYLLKNHHQTSYKRILQTVQLVAPFLADFILNPMPENAQRIRLRWQHKNAEEEFDISQLSDGTLRLICLTTLLLQPNPPKLIIIDEPELGLHPAAIGLLVEMIRSVATKSQVIISTQSVSMVSQLFPEEVIVVDQEKDASMFKRLNSKELEGWMEDYSLGEIWEMNVIGGRP
ncbi:MAG: AAA family ATPase [Blastocatellia bacterium]|nr:AAA family ATPase [Blastocatellia bacterium]